MASERFQLNMEADQRCFLAVYAEGIKDATGMTNWNDGRAIWGTVPPPDDIGFVSKLLDVLVSKYKADPASLSVTGLSSGGYMAARAVCELSERVAAAAIVAGPRDDSGCKLQRPVSILVVHGTGDAKVPYTGGNDPQGFPHPAEAEVVEFWRKHDDCAPAPAISQVNAAVELHTFTSCKAGTEVRFYTVRDGGHTWPLATDPQKFAVTPVIAEFLLAHRLTGAAAR